MCQRGQPRYGCGCLGAEKAANACPAWKEKHENTSKECVPWECRDFLDLGEVEFPHKLCPEHEAARQQQQLAAIEAQRRHEQINAERARLEEQQAEAIEAQRRYELIMAERARLEEQQAQAIEAQRHYELMMAERARLEREGRQ